MQFFSIILAGENKGWILKIFRLALKSCVATEGCVFTENLIYFRTKSVPSCVWHFTYNLYQHVDHRVLHISQANKAINLRIFWVSARSQEEEIKLIKRIKHFYIWQFIFYVNLHCRNKKYKFGANRQKKD